MIQEGTQHNPIELLDDDEELRQKEEKVAFERNRQALYQAHMGSQFDVLAAIIKIDIKGTDEQKDRVLKNRILKFFNHGAKSINVESQNFRKRRQPDYSNPATTPVDNSLIIYGVDFLNQKQVRQKFAGLNVELKWLDDSHCQVNFQNSLDAKQGIEMNLKNKNEDCVKLENQEMQTPRGWFQFQPYIYMTLKRKLFGRYAASNENQLQIQKSNDYHMYQQAKKKFQQQLAEEVTEVRYFEVMKKYKLVNEDKQRERQAIRRNRDGRDQGRNQYRDRYDDRDRNYDRRVDRDGNWQRNQRNRDSQARFNNYNRNRDNGGHRNGNHYDNGGHRNRFNDRQNREDHRDRSRDKNRRQQNKNDQLDNLSIISRAPSQPRARKQRKFSQSICSNQSPVRDNGVEDDAKSSYSFILNLNQEGNSHQILADFNNLTINEQSQRNFSRKPMKQEELNLSIAQDNYEYSRKPDLNVSLNLNDSVVSRRKPDLNVSLNLNDSVVSHRKPDLNLSLNDLNESVMSKKKNLNTSIIAEESIDMKPSRKPNVSIEQITIYD